MGRPLKRLPLNRVLDLSQAKATSLFSLKLALKLDLSLSRMSIQVRLPMRTSVQSTGLPLCLSMLATLPRE